MITFNKNAFKECINKYGKIKVFFGAIMLIVLFPVFFIFGHIGIILQKLGCIGDKLYYEFKSFLIWDWS